MKALVIAPEPFFSARGTPFSVYQRASVMSELGVEIDLLAYGEGADVEIPGVRIFRIPHPHFLGPVSVGPSLLKAILDVPLFFYALSLLIRRRYDFVHAHEEAALFCLLLRPIFGFRFVYDMHSSLPQQLSNFEFTRSRVVIRVFEVLERRCLRRADAVITISPALADYATQRMPDSGRHILIENSLLEEIRLAPPSKPKRARERTDPAAVAPRTSNPEAQLPARRSVVAYAGTFEKYQGLDLLVEAFPQVRDKRPDAFLLMVGGTRRQTDEYQALASRLGLNGDALIACRTDQSIVRRWLKKARVVVSPRSRGMNTPLKIYEQMASGVPLVATRILAHTQVLSDDFCVLVEPNPHAMAQGILAVLDDPAAARRMAQRARACYEERYGRKAYCEKVSHLLRLASRSPTSL